MTSQELELIVNWSRARNKEKLALDQRNRAEEILKEAERETRAAESALFEITPEKSVRRFLVVIDFKQLLIEVHRKAGGFGIDGVYEQKIETWNDKPHKKCPTCGILTTGEYHVCL